MTVLSDQDNSVISGNGGSGNSQSRWVGIGEKCIYFPYYHT